MDADRLYFEYYSKRAEEERLAAAAAKDSAAREKHLELAANYEEISASVAPKAPPRWLRILKRQ